MEKDNRRHPRTPYLCPVSISWEDAHGLTSYAQVRCLDISEEGLRIEVSKPILVHSRLSFRVDRINISGSRGRRPDEQCFGAAQLDRLAHVTAGQITWPGAEPSIVSY